MADRALYPTFSDAEFARRHAAARAMLAATGCACLVAYGRGRELDVLYLTNWPGTRESYVVFPAVGEPALLVQLSNHLPNAVRTAILRDVRWGGVSSTTTVAAALRERGIERGRVGVSGPLGWRDQARLAAALPQVEWVDLGDAMRRLRLVKSEEELARTREAARLTDLAMAALESEVRPGIREDELAGIVEGAYVPHGGVPGIHFMATTPMRAPRIGVPSQILSRRVVETGDVLITEIGAEHWGYSGQIHRAYAVGEEPTDAYRRIHDVAVEAYERVREVLRDGATAGDVVAAAEVIHRRGYTIYDDLFHGTDQLPPILRTSRTARGPVPDFTFRTGMVVVIQPNVVAEEGRMGVQVGETVAITPTGVERLHAFPMRFVVCRRRRTTP